MRTPPTSAAHDPRAAMGFTLIEMLVVISIILLLVGVSFPILSIMSNWSKVDAGVNTVGVAVQATRAYVDRERTGNSDPFVPPTEEKPGARFGGIAILFSPSGEIRLTRFNPGAASNAAGTNLLVNQAPTRAGFEDIPNRDYIQIPRSVEIYGIRRDGAGAGGLEFLRPPFAVRFDAHGNLITGRARDVTPAMAEDSNIVFYNSNREPANIYDTSNGSSNRADHDWSDPSEPDFQDYLNDLPNRWDEVTQSHTFDFEAIETVIGVRVVDPALYNAASPANADPRSYRDIFFSRYTGSPMRNQ